MKSPILIAVLLLSLLLNAAGIVFFILFLNERGHSKSVRKEKAALERNLAVVQSGSMMQQALNSDSTQKRTFVSELDGQIDTFAFQAPQYVPGALDYVLVVYLHGMGSNYMEPFVKPADGTVATGLSRTNPRVGILSCNYRHEASWGNDNAVADITQNIREIMHEYPFKSIVLMGTSMGGCVALNYAATAPEDIKSKIAGVVSMESSGDLLKLWAETHHREIRPAMMIAFGGAPEQVPQIYAAKSFVNNLDKLPLGSRYYVLSARADDVVPPDLQKGIIEALNKKSLPNKLEEIDGDHQAPPADFYARGLRFVLGENL
ncbi:MAG: alpha/beta hydrolase [Candidatus Obscuribacterales bacterium]|nr:alpha/beta hydrolase [Candidatus Obscuribacterales bacterium]